MIVKAVNIEPGDSLIVGGSHLLVKYIVDYSPGSDFVCVFFSSSPDETSIYLRRYQEVEIIPALPEKDGSRISRIELNGGYSYGDNVVFVRRGEWFFHSPEDFVHADEIVSFRRHED